MLVLDEEQPFILNARAAHPRLQADSFGHRVRTLYQVLGAAGEVVPSGRAAQVGHLAAAELLEVIRRRHAAGVEKVLILADAPRPRRGTLALGGDAVDRHLRLVDRDGAGLADLRTELVH